MCVRERGGGRGRGRGEEGDKRHGWFGWGLVFVCVWLDVGWVESGEYGGVVV